MLTISSIKRELPDDFSKRRGTFKVSGELLDSASKNLMDFMGLFLIVRAEFVYDERAMHYTAHSILFDSIGDFEEAPEYSFQIERESNDNALKVKAIRQQKGKKLLRLMRRIDG